MPSPQLILLTVHSSVLLNVLKPCSVGETALPGCGSTTHKPVSCGMSASALSDQAEVASAEPFTTLLLLNFRLLLILSTGGLWGWNGGKVKYVSLPTECTN